MRILRQEVCAAFGNRTKELSTTMFHKSLIVCLFAARALAGLQFAGQGFSQQARPVSAQTLPALLLKYQLVTAQRLKHPDAKHWLLTRRTSAGSGQSPL